MHYYIMDSLYEEAVIFAFQAHSGQFRKIKRIPYIIHPLNVSEIVLKWFPNHPNVDLMRTAAILHDTIEDTWVTKEIIKEKFGEKIAKVVCELSLNKDCKKSEDICYKEYIDCVANGSDEAKIIKLADMWCNFADNGESPEWVHFYSESEKMLKSLEIKDKTIKLVFDEKKEILLKKAAKYLKTYE